MTNFWNDLEQPFFALAPMEAVTDVVFRHVIAQAGAPDVWYSEFTNATGWVHAGQQAIGGRLVKTDDENPIVAQIWGGEPGDMEQLAHYCRELGYDGIDINMGCPAKSAIKSGGSALIRDPDLAARSITAAKTSGLPVSVKTRLGYSSIDEWHDWLGHLLRQDIVNLTIHLRTKREMSKVPAHHELIPDIMALRNVVAPQTLLTINGDIENRAHGEQLVRENPGLNGIMIGRGVFHDPFAFEHHHTEKLDPASYERHLKPELFRLDAPEKSDAKPSEDGMSRDSDCHNQKLVDLLRLHLDLYDQYAHLTGRPYDTLKRFFKIYIRDFEGAAAVRDKLMHTTSTAEARQIIQSKTTS